MKPHNTYIPESSILTSMQLIGREKELNSLKEFFSTNRAELIFVSGPRRVGKTTLLMNFIETHGGIYLLS
jgi:AAA+ ATPase superfamily predicted ATPase